MPADACQPPIAYVIASATPIVLAIVAALQVGSTVERRRRRKRDRENGDHSEGG